MPNATYAKLLADAQPACIETGVQYERICEHLAQFAGKGNSRTAEETRFMRLLALLVADYDRRNGLPPDDSTPAEKLRFLMDRSGTVAADLLPVFGQRSHVNEAITGKRPISAGQARELGKIFSVSPGLFV